MKPAPRHLLYQFAGLDELCLAFGNANAASTILLVPPLFDEMNRMRRVLVSVMRDLATRGIASLLLDLPGCNESLAELKNQSLYSWRDAVSAAANQLGATHIASIRGGTLIDNGPANLPHWRLAPVKGASLLKTMLRTRIAGDKESGISTSSETLMEIGRSGILELAGNAIGPDMFKGLETAMAADLATMSSFSLGDGQDAIAGSALWLRAEPQDDPAMASSITNSLENWIQSCAG